MSESPRDDRPGRDPAPKSTFRAPPQSIVVKIGAQPISLRDESSGMAPLVKPRSLEVPSGREGRYQVLGEIARGGMGVIMRGHDVDLGRDVAIKVLREDHASKPDVVQRFVEEAQIGGQLQHPGIVPVYELGQRADQRPFFTMKLVKGKTLAALLADRTDPTHDRRRFLATFEAVCHTMAYAHARGVIHRDLKPANVMVGAFGEVQVVDWGMGKVLAHGSVADEPQSKPSATVSIIATVRSESQGSDSLVGSVMGTPAYMSPEQARGAVAELDERCDVFSLGAILCEILTGQPPYSGEALTKAVNADLADAYARLEACGADDDLVRLAKSCLVPAAVARPKDAGVLAAAIGAHLASVEERAQKAQLEAAEATVKASEERRRRKLSLALAGSVVALIVLGGGGWRVIESAHRERVAETAHAVSQALDEATLLKGKAEAGDDLAPWHEAVSAAKRAEALADSKDADETTRARVRDLVAGVAAGEQAAMAKAERRSKDKEMVARLDDVRASHADNWDPILASQRYAVAFRTYGIDVEALSINDALRHIRDAGICIDLIVALDDWIDARGAAGIDSANLRDLVHACDDDPWRARLRAATGLEDVRRLADQVDLDKMTVDSLVGLANQLGARGDAGRAAALGKAVARRHPSDFWALFTAGSWAGNSRPPQSDDAVAFDTAAVAVRPLSFVAHNNLGIALAATGDTDGANREWREVVRLRPDLAIAHLILGRALSKNGDLDGAIREYHAALQINRDYAEAHDALGVALESRGEPYGAIAEFREAIRLTPGLDRARDHLGKALTDQGDPDGVITAAHEVVLLAPNDANSHVNLGIALKDKGDVDGAIEEFHTAMKLDAKLPSAHHFLAHALHEKKDFDGEIQEFREAIRLQPNSAEVHKDLGLALRAKGDVDGAIAGFCEAIRLKPEWADAHLSLGNALLKKRDFDGAMQAYREATRLKPDYAVAHYDLGLALNSNGDVDGAVEAYREAIRLDPRDADFHYALGNALKAKGMVDGAIEAYREATRLKPDDPDIHIGLGNALWKKPDLDGAAMEYREAIRLKADYGLAYENLGGALKEKGDLDGAIAAYRDAIRFTPDDADAYNGLAWILATSAREDLRDPDEAIRLARRAVELQPKDGLSVNTLGVALYRRGKFKEAVSILNHSVELRDGGSLEDWLFLAMAHHQLGDADDARRWYQEAVEAIEKLPSVSDERRRFRAEAEQVLGIGGTPR
ncbi:MAG: tetratricopeptide repeat protein [Planctomycetes bacterium]|nr:tetratricopeptide repeat protein [Planctomycetota bacterium]